MDVGVFGLRDTGERYLPKAARADLGSEEYGATSRKKRHDTQAGRQFSRQPQEIARKTAPHRHGGGAGRKDDGACETRAALYERAKERGLPGRSKMGKDELASALCRHPDKDEGGG